MLPKPKHLAPKYAAAFSARSTAEAYLHRPPYPVEVFDRLRALIGDEPRDVLDLGCGTGEIARTLAPGVAHVDAVDVSQPMLDIGRTLPAGDRENLTWHHTSAEAFAYARPYALIVTGESMHWMDWHVLFPKLRRALSANGRLAIIHNRRHLAAWDAKHLDGLAPEYSTNQDYVEWDLFDELEQRGLVAFERQLTTEPVSFQQSIDDYIEYWHSMSGFARDLMEPDAVDAFDRELRRLVEPHANDGVLTYDVIVRMAWGVPRDPS